MSTAATDESRVRAWRESVAALAAFADWLERVAVPAGLVQNVAAWETFLGRIWPVLGSVWPAQSPEEIEAAARRLERLMEECRVRPMLASWLPSITPASSVLFSAAPGQTGQRGAPPLSTQQIAAIRTTMASMLAEAGIQLASGEKSAAALSPRYANAALVEPGSARPLDPQQALAPGSVVGLRLDIGALALDSAVVDPKPIPSNLLPSKDIRLDVEVSSPHFQVGRTQGRLGLDAYARGYFILPRDGSAARAPGGGKYLYFYLRTPTGRSDARARIGYYYQNHLVQAQVLIADVGHGEGTFRVLVDYTLSESLVEVEELPARPQVSIVTGDVASGQHQIAIRSGDEDGRVLGRPCVYEVDEYAVGHLISAMRGVLRKAVVASPEKKRRKDLLIRDLRELAPLGWQLWNAIVAPRFHELYDVLDRHESVVLQVSRPATSSYAFPWGLIYDIPLISDGEFAVCPLVDHLDGASDVIAAGGRRCPEAPHGHAENTLCPFGFWGYRYPIEQLSSTDRPVTEIVVSRHEAFDVVAIETARDVNPVELAAHIQTLRESLAAEFPRAQLREATSKSTARELLVADTPLVYLYCHGERPGLSDPGVPSAIRREQVYLGIDGNEKLTPTDIAGWVLQWRREDGKKVWDRVRPLIFINACHSAEINPDTLVSYLDAFVGAAHAAGVIGTEVRVTQQLAMDVATEFLRRLFQGWTVDQALHKVRLDYLAAGNLLGLVYTPYCMADLRFATA